MRIGIDISGIVYHRGVSWYTTNLVTSLLKFTSANYTLFGCSLRQQSPLRSFSHHLPREAKIKLYPFPPTFCQFLFNQIHKLPIENFTGELDIFHAWDWYIPPTKQAGLVTTIHDLAILKFPQTSHRKILAAHRRSWKWIKKQAQVIIAVSQSTKKDIIELLQVEPKRVHVVYEALPSEHRIKVSENNMKNVKQKYSITKPYFLIVGTLEPRKNIPNMIKAWQKLKSDYQLVIAGSAGWQKLKSQPGLIFTGPVSTLDLASLYRGASCLLYASLYEGFGLPILESFYHQIPVVTANISSLPEVAGPAAVLVDPQDPSSIARGITRALSDRPSLVKKGNHQLNQFTWEKTAKQTYQVYQQILEKS